MPVPSPGDTAMSHLQSGIELCFGFAQHKAPAGSHYPTLRPYPGQLPWHNHPAFFTYQTLTGMVACKSFKSLQPRFRRLLIFYQGVNIGFCAGHKLQFLLSLGQKCLFFLEIPHTSEMGKVS